MLVSIVTTQVCIPTSSTPGSPLSASTPVALIIGILTGVSWDLTTVHGPVWSALSQSCGNWWSSVVCHTLDPTVGE